MPEEVSEVRSELEDSQHKEVCRPELKQNQEADQSALN